MSRRSLPLLAVLALAPIAPIARAQAPEKPAPAPEHRKLAFFVGKWRGEAEVKQNPFMPAGKHTSSDTCEWFPGGFAVVCRSESRTPAGATRSLGVLGYSAEEKAYTYYGVDSAGMTMSTVSKGTVEGGTWVYRDEAKMGGRTIRSRYTIRETSPTTYTFTWEMQGEDGTWTTVLEGKQRKVR